MVVACPLSAGFEGFLVPTILRPVGNTGYLFGLATPESPGNMVSILLQTLAELALTLSLLQARMAEAQEPPVIRIEMTETDRAIALLEQCESSGNYSIRVLDVNGKYSYGGLQFQLNTFWYYGIYYKILPPQTTKEQALEIIHSKDTQTQTARRMINDGLIYHWRNCAEKNGLM